MNPTYNFDGKVALVTGAASGIGFATAQAFATSGAALVLADYDETALAAATEELTTAGHQAIGVLCDVADEAQAEAMVQRAVATFGRLDMAFNNAGVQVPPSDAADEPAENFDSASGTTGIPGVVAEVRAALAGSSVMLALALVVALVVILPAGRPVRAPAPRPSARRDDASSRGPKGALAVPRSTGTPSVAGPRLAWRS